MRQIALCLVLVFSSGLGHGLSFDQAFEKILQNYPAYELLKERRASEMARARPGYLAWMPSLMATVNQTDASSNYGLFSRARWVGLNSTWVLFSGGAHWAELRAAQLSQDLAERTYQRDYQKLEREILSAMFEFIVQKEGVELAVARIQNKEQNLVVARRMYERGRIPLMEFEKLEIELSNLRAANEDLVLKERQSELDLVRYLGDEAIELQWPWMDRLRKAAGRLKESDRDGQLQSLDLAVVDLEARLQDPLVSKARAAWLPNLSLNAGYGRAFDRYTPLGEENAWNLALTLSIPLFQRLELWSSYRAQVFERSAKQKELELTRRQVRQSLEYSYEELMAGVRTASERERILEKSRKLFERSLKLFRSGRVDVNYLTTDEERWLTSRELALEGWRRAHQALVDFCHHRGQVVASCWSSLSKEP